MKAISFVPILALYKVLLNLMEYGHAGRTFDKHCPSQSECLVSHNFRNSFHLVFFSV